MKLRLLNAQVTYHCPSCDSANTIMNDTLIDDDGVKVTTLFLCFDCQREFTEYEAEITVTVNKPLSLEEPECPNCSARGYDPSKGCMFCNEGNYYQREYAAAPAPPAPADEIHYYCPNCTHDNNIAVRTKYLGAKEQEENMVIIVCYECQDEFIAHKDDFKQ